MSFIRDVDAVASGDGVSHIVIKRARPGAGALQTGDYEGAQAWGSAIKLVLWLPLQPKVS